MKIIIYGAGKYGRWFYRFLKKLGIKVDNFCQTAVDSESYCEDVKVIGIEQLPWITEEITVFIAIRDGGICSHVRKKLLNLNRPDMHIYECGSFIDKNLMDMQDENPCYCNLCGEWIEGFRDCTYALSDIFIKYRVSGGGGMREHDTCPLCGCRARFRWQYWVLAKYTDIFQVKCTVLHIAPEPEIGEKIQSNEQCDYYKGELNRMDTDTHIVDVTDIQFRDNFFDYIIMNHVLEHIEDESRALLELKRVLRPNGKLILSFPICTDMDSTYENPETKTPEERIKEFGQGDHVRLYGKDFKVRLEKYGFRIDVKSPQNECSQEQIIKYGFDYDDVNLICTC